MLVNTSAQSETRVLEQGRRPLAGQSQIAGPIGRGTVLSTLQHRGNSSPAHGGGTQGRPDLTRCPLQSCPLDPHSVGGGSPGHRDPTRAAERDGPCVLTTLLRLSLHNPIFKNLLDKYSYLITLAFVKHRQALHCGQDPKPRTGTWALVQGFVIWQLAFHEINSMGRSETAPAAHRPPPGPGSAGQGRAGTRELRWHLQASCPSVHRSPSESAVSTIPREDCRCPAHAWVSVPRLAVPQQWRETQSLCGFSGTPMASCRPMFPTVTPPEKKMQGSQERM